MGVSESILFGTDGLVRIADFGLARANDELCETVSGGTFVCAAVGFYDPMARTAVWANAGLHWTWGAARAYVAP